MDCSLDLSLISRNFLFPFHDVMSNTYLFLEGRIRFVCSMNMGRNSAERVVRGETVSRHEVTNA